MVRVAALRLATGGLGEGYIRARPFAQRAASCVCTGGFMLLTKHCAMTNIERRLR